MLRLCASCHRQQQLLAYMPKFSTVEKSHSFTECKGRISPSTQRGVGTSQAHNHSYLSKCSLVGSIDNCQQECSTCREVPRNHAKTVASWAVACIEDTMCKPTKLPCLHCLHKRCFMQDLCLSDRTTIKLRCEDISNVFMKGGANTTHAVQQCNYKLD